MLRDTPKSKLYRLHPVPKRGALRDRHERWVRDAVDAMAHKTNAPLADGEIVWSWHLDADAKLARMLSLSAPMTVTRKPDRRGERDISR